MKNYLRIDEITDDLDVSTDTVRRLIHDGKLLAFSVREGGGLRIPAESYRRYVRNQILEFQEKNGIDADIDAAMGMDGQEILTKS